MQRIERQCFDEERALYHLTDAEVVECDFAGPADGESALKESRRVTVENCRFSLRYPLWHAQSFTLRNSRLDELTRAPLWYTEDGVIEGCTIESVKCLRECDRTAIAGSRIVSPEFGWRCRTLSVTDSYVESEYCLFEAKGVTIDRLKMKGKYSFQYVENMVIRHADLDTKDAFWHSKNVRVEDSVIRGEYLGWYTEGLTLVNCHLIGTQPLCYCKDLTLVNCTMEGTDLAFEYSDVEADVRGHILSVKNPRSGHIMADSIGEIVTEGSVMDSTCRISLRTPVHS